MISPRQDDEVLDALARAMASDAGGQAYDPQDGSIRSGEQPAGIRERLVAIPERRQIEQREHLRAFLDDYAPDEPYLHDQAYEALLESQTPADWRRRLGERHRAVLAFDAWMTSFYRTMARMFLVSQRRAHLGILGYGHAGRH